MLLKRDKKVQLANITLILARKNQDMSYSYVDSKSDSNYSNFSMKLNDLPAGDYVLCCFA